MALTGRELVCAVDVLLRVAFPYPGSLPKEPFFEAPWVSIQCVQGIRLQGEQEMVSRDLMSLIELEAWTHVREEASLGNFPGGHRSLQIVRTNKRANKGISHHSVGGGGKDLKFNSKFYVILASWAAFPRPSVGIPLLAPAYGLEGSSLWSDLTG